MTNLHEMTVAEIDGATLRRLLIAKGAITPRAERADGLVDEHPAIEARIAAAPCLALDERGRARGRRDAGRTGDARILGQRDERGTR